MADMQWWEQTVRELTDDTLEQVASGISNTSVDGCIIAADMHDMAIAELGRRSRIERTRGY